MSKAEKLRIPEYLGHILEAIRRIESYVRDMSEAEFLDDPKTQDAVIRNFEIIGEACRNVDAHHADFASKHPEVPWGFAYEMRNALAHGYFKVDLRIVWTTVRKELPDLSAKILSLLNEAKKA